MFWDTCLYMQMNFNDIPLLIHRVSFGVGPPFAAITASTLLRRLSTRFRIVFMRYISGYLYFDVLCGVYAIFYVILCVYLPRDQM